MVLTLGEVADRLKVSERTVRREIDAGRLNPIRVRSAVRVSLTELERYVASSAPCQSVETPMAGGTRKSAYVANAYTESCRKVRVRVTPSASRPN